MYVCRPEGECALGGLGGGCACVCAVLTHGLLRVAGRLFQGLM